MIYIDFKNICICPVCVKDKLSLRMSAIPTAPCRRFPVHSPLLRELERMISDKWGTVYYHLIPPLWSEMIGAEEGT